MELMSKCDSYELFIKEIAADFPRFKALVAFLSVRLNTTSSEKPSTSRTSTSKGHNFSSSGSSTNTVSQLVISGRHPNRSSITHHITRLQFNQNETPIATPVDIDKLEEVLSEQNAGHQIFVVNDLSPRALKLFGGYWNIDPQFFLDYLDLLPKKARANERGTRPAPWFRHEDIEHHLPMLRSNDADMEHVSIRYVGPREYLTEDENTFPPRLGSNDLYEPELDNCYIQRVGGGLDPIHPEHRSFWKWLSSALKLTRGDPLSLGDDFLKLWPVTMIRHSAAAWFSKETSGQWKNGIILLDPPTEPNHGQLKRFRSKYRAFSSRPMPGREHNPVDTRVSYANTILHCLTSNIGIPTPLAVLQPIYQIVASEWIVVNAYLERDLNALEWRFEHTTPDDLTLEFFRKELSIMRRRARKYGALVYDQLQLTPPAYWQNSSATPNSPDPVYLAIRADINQVQELMHQNNERIKEFRDLISSMMSVREGKKSNAQSQGLVFLGLVATVALPFNAFAAVYNMNNEYAPGRPGWAYVRKSALITVVSTVGCYMLIFVVFWARNKRVIH